MDKKPQITEELEATYRKGYHQGYAQAVSDIKDMLASGVPVQDIIQRTRQFETEALAKWRHTKPFGEAIYPPKLVE